MGESPFQLKPIALGGFQIDLTKNWSLVAESIGFVAIKIEVTSSCAYAQLWTEQSFCEPIQGSERLKTSPPHEV